MRKRAGKGQIFALDAKMIILVEKFRQEKEYYPTLREIGETFNPPLPAVTVFRSLRRLAAAGKLSPEAMQVYDSKNINKGDTHENNIKKHKSKTSR
jgi:hypothetical protein